MGGANDAHSHRIGRHAVEAERDRACARAARRTRPFFSRVAWSNRLVFWSQVGAWRGLEIELVKLKLLKTETFSNRISTAHALMVRAALLRRSCDGVAAATEMRRPAPSRSFCASRLSDATRRMRTRPAFIFPVLTVDLIQWSWPTVLGHPPGPVILYRL